MVHISRTCLYKQNKVKNQEEKHLYNVTNNISNGSCNGMTVSHHAQYHDPETEAAKWNSAILNLLGLFTTVF